MQKPKIDWISNLRLISAVAVVVLHVCVPYVAIYDLHPGDRSWWIIGNVMNSLVRFCVPVFVMISGVTWLKDTSPTLEFYKKKSLRLIGPFLLWSLADYFFNMFYMQTQNSDVHVFEDFTEKLRSNQISAHFWYVYMLIGLFMIAPVFKGWVQNVWGKDILIFLVIWATIMSYQYPVFNSGRTVIDVHLFVGYIGYLVLGYYLANHIKASESRQLLAGTVLFIVGVASTAIGTQILSDSEKNFNGLMYDYLTLNVLLASIGAFLLGKNLHLRNRFAIMARDSVARHGYGIYLAHIMGVQLISKQFDAANYHPLVYVPAISLSGLLITWGFIYVANKIPKARYVLG